MSGMIVEIFEGTPLVMEKEMDKKLLRTTLLVISLIQLYGEFTAN